METPKNITFSFDLDQTNLILKWLGKGPFDETAALIQKIQTEGVAQIQAQQPKTEVADAKASKAVERALAKSKTIPLPASESLSATK